MSVPGNKNLYRIYENHDFYDIVTLENDKTEKIEKNLEKEKFILDFIINKEKYK
ncbi:hypothetical protein [Leptotrichia sp. OH3620_COT-345]|uniref:hypothetical protein n=1 Tax=Leptotrichia sp. OH3620_COT-345 TaxID=2491048 RepID=UPI001F2E0532|nr:hypothetical protein [Leptotrichia sp. OH3620_COT-345]